jgi:hypothetical protein
MPSFCTTTPDMAIELLILATSKDPRLEKQNLDRSITNFPLLIIVMDLEQRSALGRKVPVGTYYNARTDTFLSESILKPNLPSEVMTIAEVNSVDVKFAYEETFGRKV